MSDSASLFPLLLPQPQKPPHPLFLYHSSLSLSLFHSATPLFFMFPSISPLLPLTADLNLSLYLHKAGFPGSVPVETACLMKHKSSHMRAVRDKVYIWNVLCGQIPQLYLSKQKWNEQDVKKNGSGLEGTFLSSSGVYLGWSLARWGTGHAGYLRAAVCHYLKEGYLLFEKK